MFDVSNMINISRELAERYSIIGENLQHVCDQNIAVAIHTKRCDAVKIWEMLKFITLNGSDRVSLDPSDGKPWSISTFGRPLANYLLVY